MKKDAYYFPHFSNARNDSKVLKIRRIFGIEGYGIYFMLLEVLREQTDYKLPLSSIEDLGYEWHISKEKIVSVINDFDLFEIIENRFFSPKLVLYLQPYIEKSDRARQAAFTRWNNLNDAKALQKHSKCNASKVKESKVIEYIYNEFYDFELRDCKNEKYIQFIKYLFGDNMLKKPLTGILSIKDQLKQSEFETILSKCTANKKKLGDILTKIENDVKYYKGKKSLYRTLLNWSEDRFIQ